ncbi:MAG: hypothetical protein NW237_17785 [Cyanobacteriota bacterium]|nr:hypothetical protein [Cyanobacteriota bacterium]
MLNLVKWQTGVFVGVVTVEYLEVNNPTHKGIGLVIQVPISG